jgi:tRNA pseudouridine55 synthase
VIPDGVVVVNKPAGWTSHDVVNKMRGIAGTRRVGHLGTLDPIATGVLPVMIGQITRLARFWGDSEKMYEAVVRFGFATTTWDREGEPVSPSSDRLVTADEVEACLVPFRGEIEQKPPPVSARKIGGVPAYKLARKNIPFDLAPVRICIHELTLHAVKGNRARIAVRCSTGTYIRSIAHELGIALGCGAHVEELIRCASGPFDIGNAITLGQLRQMKEDGCLEDAVIKPSNLLPQFPSVFPDQPSVDRIRQGRDFEASEAAEHVKAIGPDGALVAIGHLVSPHLYHPVVVLGPSPLKVG